MTTNKTIQDIVNEKLSSGLLEEKISQELDNTINNVVADLFGPRGDITYEIKDKLRETIHPAIHAANFDEYKTKLDTLFTTILNDIASEDLPLLENIKTMFGSKRDDEVTVTNIFDKFTEFAAQEVDTTNLEICDDSPHYEDLTCELITKDKPTISDSREAQSLIFTCKEDEKLNVIIHIERFKSWKHDKFMPNSWTISGIELSEELQTGIVPHSKKDIIGISEPIRNIRYLKGFPMQLLKYYHDDTRIALDDTHILDEDIEVDAEPQPTWE